MGTGSSKSALEGDDKFMEMHCSGSTQFLEKWRKKYGFSGRLDERGLIALIEKLRASAAGKTKYQWKTLMLTK